LLWKVSLNGKATVFDIVAVSSNLTIFEKKLKWRQIFIIE
jgi:hypothetical protein